MPRGAFVKRSAESTGSIVTSVPTVEGALGVERSTTSDVFSNLFQFAFVAPAAGPYIVHAAASGFGIALSPVPDGPLGQIAISVDGGPLIRSGPLGYTPANAVGDNFVAWNASFVELVALAVGAHTVEIQWACQFPGNVNTFTCQPTIVGAGYANVVVQATT